MQRLRSCVEHSRPWFHLAALPSIIYQHSSPEHRSPSGALKYKCSPAGSPGLHGGLPKLQEPVHVQFFPCGALLTILLSNFRLFVQISFSGPEVTGAHLRAVLDCMAGYPCVKNLCMWSCNVGDEVRRSWCCPTKHGNQSHLVARVLNGQLSNVKNM